ncbi:hypothetical protein MVEN_00582500 [Mycena venus]|uniref:F-box domain-containing protein n=1 Tax=Mycena venus TaxID=2733690 RepID=A0A8H6YJI1_9AGAR|nr:hypothetical protein MVEN_00582500 [Mycena venus]
MLPSSSPLLHTLQMKIKIPYEDQAFPDSAYSELIDTINSLYLPVLTTIDLSVNLVPDDLWDYFCGKDLTFLPRTNFTALLTTHPHLVHLTLSALGTEIKEDLGFLPRLISFQGPFRDAAVICARQRQLQKLIITPSNDCADFFPTFHPLPLPNHPSLTKLCLLAVDSLGSPMKMTELSPNSFACLISSFPNLAHLDACINKPVTKYRNALISLTQLQNLRLQQYTEHFLAPPNWPACLVFPATNYIKEIDTLLPSLTQLTDVEICILADIHPASAAYVSDTGSESDSYCDEWYYDRMDSAPDIQLEYFFSVIRPVSGAQVVLDLTRVMDSYS